MLSRFLHFALLDMSINVHRDTCRCVAHESLHRFQVFAAGNGDCGIGVPKNVGCRAVKVDGLLDALP